jgi:hypothetical protein
MTLCSVIFRLAAMLSIEWMARNCWVVPDGHTKDIWFRKKEDFAERLFLVTLSYLFTCCVFYGSQSH